MTNATIAGPVQLSSTDLQFCQPRSIPVVSIRLDGGNHRSEQALDVAGLAESIATVGQLTPILVTPDDLGYRIVASPLWIATF
jgi:hypothetical protein